ncbi:MAG: peptidoglycan-binding protein [Blastocatellia bacterium]|nr:peptidoglycan-binding protein [Blastocatellia bacterium]MBL8195125.1 peptidoglycan-binding protein [Blastocatellia bacterium]MBN8723699.1 peptidoglycan-binding protein [Acidobacteriota bacterium]
MIKKLLTVVFLAMLTLTTVVPDDALAKGKRRAVASKKAKSRGGKKAVARGKSKKSSSRVARNSRGKKSRRSRGEFIARGPSVSIPPERVREIQIALKREGYFADEPSGQYDKTTVEAMTKYQQDHNFRKTGYPTAESLQKLGLTRQRRVTTGEPTNENKSSVELDNNSNPPQQPISK